MARNREDSPVKRKVTESAPEKKNLVAIKGYTTWKDWLEEYASFKRMSVVELIDKTLEESAKRDGFRKPPPRY